MFDYDRNGGKAPYPGVGPFLDQHYQLLRPQLWVPGLAVVSLATDDIV